MNNNYNMIQFDIIFVGEFPAYKIRIESTKRKYIISTTFFKEIWGFIDRQIHCPTEIGLKNLLA